MLIFIVMLNSGGDHSEKQHGEAVDHGTSASTDHDNDPTAYKEAVEPDAKAEKLASLNQVLETIAATDNRPVTESGEDDGENPLAAKISPDVAIGKLIQGNIRFAKGEPTHPNLDAERRLLAATESQADHAFATVLACSDSRVPVEAIFDAGVMDIFTVRVAGNVCDVDERGSIEYGLAHVHTPVLVVMGHTQCGAVTAVTQAVQGHGHALERNIPDLVANIEPAVKNAMELNPDLKGDDIIPIAIEENVWSAIEELFMQSPVTREYVSNGYVKVVGAIYDIGTGNVDWLSEDKTLDILAKVEASEEKAVMEVGAVKDSHEEDAVEEESPQATEDGDKKATSEVEEDGDKKAAPEAEEDSNKEEAPPADADKA
ncbi:MAG: carbonic anhydrase [Desulfamplus sp.]|nr:carbonic anhydrase [Desulfamplus sp.]